MQIPGKSRNISSSEWIFHDFRYRLCHNRWLICGEYGTVRQYSTIRGIALYGRSYSTGSLLDPVLGVLEGRVRFYVPTTVLWGASCTPEYETQESIISWWGRTSPRRHYGEGSDDAMVGVVGDHESSYMAVCSGSIYSGVLPKTAGPIRGLVANVLPDLTVANVSRQVREGNTT